MTWINELISFEVSQISNFCDQLIQIKPRPFDQGTILERSKSPKKSTILTDNDWDNLKNRDPESRCAFLIAGNINHDLDIQKTFIDIYERLHRHDRLLAVLYNPYFAWVYKLANGLGLRKDEIPSTFLTRKSLNNLARLSGFEVCSLRPAIYFPWKLFGVGMLINFIMPIVPVLRWLCLVNLAVLRPIKLSTVREGASRRGLSVVIPCKNERGNIESAVKELLYLRDHKIPFEILFVEGHSEDGTPGEIDRVKMNYGNQVEINSLVQTQKGKADAVRLGFENARFPLVAILDADLTMPPELLIRFYEAYEQGHADFINGSRLLYPMQGGAMRFLNRLGNEFFAWALSVVMGVKITDSLCGTKLLAKRDWERSIKWRESFGDFDPFGDFELLFPASQLGFGIIDVPISYRARKYGETQIHRFTHGWMLLKMTIIGLVRLKTGKVRS